MKKKFKEFVETTEKGTMSNVQVGLIAEQIRLNGAAHYLYYPNEDGNYDVLSIYPDLLTKDDWDNLKKEMGDVDLYFNPFCIATREYVIEYAKRIVDSDQCFQGETDDELLRVAYLSNGWELCSNSICL